MYLHPIQDCKETPTMFYAVPTEHTEVRMHCESDFSDEPTGFFALKQNSSTSLVF